MHSMPKSATPVICFKDYQIFIHVESFLKEITFTVKSEKLKGYSSYIRKPLKIFLLNSYREFRI